MASNADLEYARLLVDLEAVPVVSLADLRSQRYTPTRHAYFAALSGLTPAASYSLSDHRLAYYRGVAGISSGSLADAIQEALN